MFPTSHGIGVSLPPWLCCPLLPTLGGGLMWTGHNDGRDLTKRQFLLVWVLHQEWQNINFQVNRLACSKTCTAGQWLWQGGYNGLIRSIQTYGVNNLRLVMRSWQTSSWLICLQGVTSASLRGRIPMCPFLGSGKWWVPLCNHTKA